MACRSRSSRSGIAFVAALLALPAAAAADMPPIKTNETNHVAQCATPGRLMAYVRERNSKLNPRYDGLASEYMRHGEELNVRWDYAFFQMLLETGYLNYGGDVKPDQNNFAGLGATGRGARGESFKDISTGARAHLEHLVMYSGERVESPVAERTRNIQEWGVLTNWQKGISGPITFTQLAKQWAPTSRRYAVDIETIAGRFFDGICKQEDPQPELVAEIRGTTPVKTASADVADAPSKTRGLDAQRRAVEAAKAEGGSTRSSLGGQPAQDAPPAKSATVSAVAEDAKVPAQKASMSPPLTVLNSAPSDQAPVEAHAADKGKDTASSKPSKNIEVAALPGGGAIGDSTKADKPAKAEKKEAAPSGKCRVWTASYGGSKAIIIKAAQDKTVNYTVLDVNEGSEKREADAYINAYAKGGQSVGEFGSQSQALEKAFELCPEG